MAKFSILLLLLLWFYTVQVFRDGDIATLSTRMYEGEKFVSRGLRFPGDSRKF